MIKNKQIILPIALLLYTITGDIQAKRPQTKRTPSRQTQTKQAPVKWAPTRRTPAGQIPIRRPQTQQVAQLLTAKAMAGTVKRLSDFYYTSASVLPFFVENGKRYFILSREAFGSDANTYDDFGGSREFVDNKNKINPIEKHPVITAAREFFEEAILKFSTNYFLHENTVKNFIDLDATISDTAFVIAYLKNVTYITDFSSYKDEFFKKFYHALNKARSLKMQDFTEKDRLAVVEWDKLATTITQSNFNTNVKIDVFVLNPYIGRWQNEQVTLRGFFVKKLRPFFAESKKYQTGLNPKIRFYDDNAAIITGVKAVQFQQPTQVQPQASWSTRFWNWMKS